MKKLHTLIFTLLISGLSFLNGQNVSFTVKAGGGTNVAKIYVKADAELTGVVSSTLLTLTLPASVGSAPEPIFSLNAAFSHVAQSLTSTTETVEGVSSYVFTYSSAYAGSLTNTLPMDTEVEFGQVEFFNLTEMNFTLLKLVNLPNGGTSSISYLLWEVGGVNHSNATDLCYGPGHVNSASGFEGYSFVPIDMGLPVKFLSFIAVKNGDDAKLSWTVESDASNKYFEVERSFDAKSFSTLSKVNAIGNGKSINTYELRDAALSNLNTKIVYYRIKQVDKDNVVTYSNIRNLNVTKNGTAVSLFPNPVKTTTKLVIDAPLASNASIIIRDAQGKLVRTINTKVVAGINQQDINLTELSAGEYNVTVASENLIQTIKLSKIK